EAGAPAAFRAARVRVVRLGEAVEGVRLQLAVGPDRLEVELVPVHVGHLGAALPKEEGADYAVAARELHSSFEAAVGIRLTRVKLGAARRMRVRGGRDSADSGEQSEQGSAEGREAFSHDKSLRASESGSADDGSSALRRIRHSRYGPVLLES